MVHDRPEPRSAVTSPARAAVGGVLLLRLRGAGRLAGGLRAPGLRPADGVAWYWAAFVSVAGVRIRRSCSSATTTCPCLVAARSKCGRRGCGPTTRARRPSTTGPSAWRPSAWPSTTRWRPSPASGATAARSGSTWSGKPSTSPAPLPVPAPATWRLGYEQPCTVHGEVLVGSERLELDGVGWRTHLWGDQDWWADDPPAAWAGGHFDADGPPFATGEVETVTEDGLIRSATLPASTCRPHPWPTPRSPSPDPAGGQAASTGPSASTSRPTDAGPSDGSSG